MQHGIVCYPAWKSFYFQEHYSSFYTTAENGQLWTPHILQKSFWHPKMTLHLTSQYSNPNHHPPPPCWCFSLIGIGWPFINYQKSIYLDHPLYCSIRKWIKLFKNKSSCVSTATVQVSLCEVWLAVTETQLYTQLSVCMERILRLQ